MGAMQSATVDRGDFTNGSMLKNIIRMAIPISLALFVNILYSTVDRMYIGHIPGAGRIALTGVGLVSPIISIITAFQRLWGSGSSPLFAIERGKKNDNAAAEIMKNACFMLILTALILTVVLLVLKKRILYWIGASDETFEYADTYFSIYCLGTVFTMFAMGMNPFIHAQGRAKTGMLTVIIGAVVNIVLDPVLIFVFKMGVRGAAIATVIAQICSAGWMFFILRSNRLPIKLELSSFRPDFAIIRQMFGLGITEFTFSLTTSLSLLTRNIQLRNLGNGSDIYVGCMAVLSSVHELFVMATHGLTDATKPIVSYNYGAQRYDRVKKGIFLLTCLTFGYLTFIWVLTRTVPHYIVKIFCDDADLIEPCVMAIRLYFMAIFMLSLQVTSQSMSVALGKGKQALCLSLFRKVVLVMGLTLILPRMFNLGVKGVFLSEPISDIIGGLTSYSVMLFTVIKELNSKEKQMEIIK